MRTRDEIMTQWDVTRREIAGGCTSSGPRDWIEGVLDEREQRIAELEAALRVAIDAVNGEGHVTVKDIHAAAAVLIK